MTTQCFRLFTPIDDPPGASQYLAKWHGYGAGHVFSEMAPVTEPLRPLLAGAAAQLKAIPHGSPVTSGQVQLPMTNTLGVPRHPLSLPLTETAVKALHELSDASSLGVEGRGTVHDTNLRKSREVVVGTAGLHLSKQLMNFNFPAARKQVQDALFQTAADVEYRPYKLVLYAPGDFFVAHADSMSEAHMFGSLALQIPVQPPPSSGDEDVGGALVFYPLTGGELSFDLTSLGPPRTDDSVSVTYAAWLGDVQHEVREVKHHRIVLLYRLFKRGDEWKAVPRNSLSAIRETVDAVFDVSRSCHLPVEKTIEPFVLEPKYECTQEVPSAGEIIIDPVTQRGQPTAFRVSCLGILLQHQYPPAGLTPSALKGLDALLHRALSQSYRCHLISVLESREAMYDPRYDTGRPRISPVIRNVVLTDSLERYTSFGYESVSVPVVMAAWINLALGTGCAVGGGHMLGNGDCETEWWYRSTALMVLPSTRWDRCRWFFLALSKGSAPGLQRLYAVQDVFQHMMGFVA